MLRIAFAGALALCAVVSTADRAEARRIRASGPVCSDLDQMRGLCVGSRDSARRAHALKRGGRYSASRADRAHQRASYSVSPTGYSIHRPSRYIAGRLICAVNVGVALAERGIRGTGSALALSYLHWGRSAGGPVPGAVIVSARRGGGHVAIVSRVEGGIVYAWNATGGQHGWREIPYRHHVIDYRVPG